MCDTNFHVTLTQNMYLRRSHVVTCRSVYLSGGATQIPGFIDRLQLELNKFVPSSIVVEVNMHIIIIIIIIIIVICKALYIWNILLPICKT